MRQIGGEKDDPLKRIQEEINEVARREQELREKMQLQQQPPMQQDGESLCVDSTDSSMLPDEAANCVGLDESHSDDSGISASSSPVNGTSANNNERKYIRPNSYSITPKLPPQKLLLRASSTPQITLPGRRFNVNPAQKGIMQRFIASRGRLGTQQIPSQQYANLTSPLGRDSGSPILPIELTRNNVDFLPTSTITPPIIERDEDGRPIRRGYVPVEEKIQKELRDLKSRESELKRIRKFNSRQSQPDLLDSIEDEDFQSDDSDVEHCFAPGKLRATKSISELCDMTNINSLSPRTTPSPCFERKALHSHQGLRPALSLAQLCDLDPDDAPSSHDLIAKWESLIQKNA